jgi:RNA polymerase sigma-70 factor (ECF subfamily)
MNVARPLPAQDAPRPRYLSVAAPLNARSPMPSSDELSQLILAVAQQGDRQAFAALFKYFAPRVKSYLLRTGSHEHLAEEVAQETLVSVWRKAGSFDPAHGHASTWVFTIARNLRVDHVRRRGLHIASGLDLGDEAMDDCAPSSEDALRSARRERGVREALARMTSQQAQLVRLSFFEEHPHAQIAQEMGMPLGTVKSRIRAAIGRLREMLDGIES